VVTIADVSRMALELPEAVEAERRGSLIWAVGAKTFAWERPFSKADIKRFGTATPPEGPILAVRVEDLGEKEAVLAANPKAFFTIPHFDGFSAVLIQLGLATTSSVKEALVDGWLCFAPPELAAEFLKR
jgi:hypothetical protein